MSSQAERRWVSKADSTGEGDNAAGALAFARTVPREPQLTGRSNTAFA